jgi:hypothetical protein
MGVGFNTAGCDSGTVGCSFGMAGWGQTKKKIKNSSAWVRFKPKKWVIPINELDHYTISSFVLIVIDIYIYIERERVKIPWI